MKSLSRGKRGYFRKSSTGENLGFQIAPMIDVVFVILLFFIAQASVMPVESQHLNKLPTCMTLERPDNLYPDEIAVRVDHDGQVYLNEDPVDGVSDGRSAVFLPELAGSLGQLKQVSDASGSPVLVTLQTDGLVKYQRVMDVLDALARVGIGTVTFEAVAD